MNPGARALGLALIYTFIVVAILVFLLIQKCF